MTTAPRWRWALVRTFAWTSAFGILLILTSFHQGVTGLW